MKDVLKNFSYIKDYIPVILAILTPILTYLIGVRKGNNEKFDLQLENNLKDVISPMLHEIKAITRQQEESNERNKLLKKFFEKYGASDSKLYEMSNKYICDKYYETEKYYYKFMQNKNQNNWEDFWTYFISFNKLIDNEYNKIKSILYSNYVWLMDLSNKNKISRVFMEIMVMFYELSKFILMACIIFLIAMVIYYEEDKSFIHGYDIKIMILLSLAILIVNMILSSCLSEYIQAIQNQKDSMIKKYLRRKHPNIIKKYDEFIYFDLEKEKRKLHIPRM
ncbi:hypothetical protein [Clostridium hydrogenum]|uniref:hypothetical protein n=1 Tax=Clostridium hydrogenum TaxID=2855764 RepID=UPI001F1E9087|nr:hypothetical protein [Clostridium hydrogenum]